MRKSALSREEMLDRLLEVFRQKGFEGASLVDLMQATSLQKGSLYHHFPGGKGEMAEAVLAHVERLFEAMVFAPLREATTAANGLAAMSRALESYFASGAKVCLPALMGLGASRDQFGAAIEGFFERWIDTLAETLAKDGMPAEQALFASEQMVADIQGGIVLARALGRTEPFLRALGRVRAPTAGAE
ncbi:MAG TPA: TetR/AcrR family transcriptional regulator [Patescibacteria group bacterium]|nr:TetR/AcrR family transcriptional regulator [Patescibacteria group bacterium]